MSLAARRSSEARSERGAATVLVLAMAGVLVLVAAAVAGVAGLVHAHRTAQAAADLAALAGAAEHLRGGGGCARAATFAEANGARLVACRTAAGWLEVEVEVAPPVGLGLSEALRAVARAGPGSGSAGAARPPPGPAPPGPRGPSPGAG